MTNSDLSKSGIEDLEKIGADLQAMSDRVENWEPLAPALARRIQEDARMQAQIGNPNANKSEEEYLTELEWGYIMSQPSPGAALRELSESDVFRPIPTADAGTFTSGRELQVLVDPSFEWTPETLDRVEQDVMDFYVEGEINA